MRFEELTVHEADGTLRLPFHPHLTVLAGLGPDERVALAHSLVAALVGGDEHTTLRYLDATGGTVVVEAQGGRATARDAAGTEVHPLAGAPRSPASLAALLVVGSDDITPEVHRAPEDEPAELREARTTLADITAELEAGLAERERSAELRAELHQIDAALHAAREGAARRAYAQVLARLEQVRTEAAALQSDAASVDADRRLLSAAASIRDLAAQHAHASARLAELTALASDEPVDPHEVDRLATIPEAPPVDVAELLDRAQQTAAERAALEQRLQDLAVATLPAPSDPVVAELGVLEQGPLWSAARRLADAHEAMHEVRVSLGGLELDDVGAAPALVAEIEAAHAEVDDAERAAGAVRIPAMAATVLGAAAGVLGVATAPLLVPVGLGAAGVAAVAGIVLPDRRHRRALRAERLALERAGATSYLGFHIRRVEATVDPRLRARAEAAVDEQRAAWTAWSELVGPDLPVERALEVADEVAAYHAALQDLGETAEEMDHLRQELASAAIPAAAAARTALAEACRPYLLDDGDLDRPDLLRRLDDRCRAGAAARAQATVHEAEDGAGQLADALLGQLVAVGFGDGDVADRLEAFEAAAAQAEARTEARRRARPLADVAAEVEDLEAQAAALHRPDWGAVTAAEAEAPDVEQLEARRELLTEALGTARAVSEVDLDRLRDRQSALGRRVATLEAKLGTYGDPGAIADLQQGLLARLTAAAQAGPGGDPIPVVLDEVFLRVPPDRTWDLLDLVLRLAERHQVIYLTDDAFVAAWARQRALEGSITLLETDSGAEATQTT
ncbi:MAG: hypothetical protein ACLGI8_10650 [Acidimicrobiia bacterium]